MRVRLIAFFLLISTVALAQNNAGGIYGKVTGDDGKPLEFATVRAFLGGALMKGDKTDELGNFSLKPLSPGEYDVVVTFSGMDSAYYKGVRVYTDRESELKIKMKKKGTLKEVVITATKAIDAANPGDRTITKERLENISSFSLADMASLNSSVFQAKQGSNSISIGGERANGTQIIVDGVLMTGNINLPPNIVDAVEVMNTGVSAKYGNATGGFVSYNTIGISPLTRGGIQAQTSVEGYFNNKASFNLSGPLLMSKKDSIMGRRPIMGYLITGSVDYNKDPDPYFYRYKKLKPEFLEQVQNAPIVQNPNGSQYLSSAEAFTDDHFTTVKARENGENYLGSFLGKLNYTPTTRMNVGLTAQMNAYQSKGWALSNSIFAPEANSINRGYSGMASLRLMQSLGKPNVEGGNKSPISNAFYSILLSYQRSYNDSRNPVHQRNTFDYGYLGHFQQHRSPFYTYNDDIDVTLSNGQTFKVRGIQYQGDFSDSVTFSPEGLNPLLENYTKQIYNNNEFVPSLAFVPLYGGLRNGDGPNSVNGLFVGPGAQIGSYGYNQSDRYNLSLDASFDIKQGVKRKGKKVDPINHQIEFGMGYQQDVQRSYSVAASSLWSLMRLKTNNHIVNFDLDNPRFVVNGQEYTKEDIANGSVIFTDFDTIKYNRLYAGNEQSRWDKELRTKLGLPGGISDLTWVDIDNLDRSLFSLDMFSAEDLYVNGAAYIGYYGYDYLGNKLKKQPSFKDFWTKKDGRGDYERPIGTFNPNYMYGYITDKFRFQGVHFNIGLRVDRYDANQLVLKDPYSLYGRKTLSSLKGEGVDYRLARDKSNNNSKAPDPLTNGYDKEWVPYVDNNQSSTPTIVGYRKGDIWYDPFGREIADPDLLSGLYANGLPIQPYLIDPNDSIKSPNYKIDNAFQDYKPDVKLSPRIQFVFPLNDKSQFYGNYDIYTQNPPEANFVTPDDYYYFTDRNSGIGNSNLRIQQAVNYTLGFEQALGNKNRSKVGLELKYIERKDQIQAQTFRLAYPLTYTSYGNRDFSSVKAFTLKYNMKRTKRVEFSFDYTLQFVEGTGSSSTGSYRIFQYTSQPNYRAVFPLNNDARHTLNINIDYRFKQKEDVGPKIGKHYIFNGFGTNLLFRSRSGTPYTRSSLASFRDGGSRNLNGSINGSRLPWYYDLGLKMDKTIPIWKKYKDGDHKGEINYQKAPTTLKIYSIVNNLLNTRNVIGVYSYTGLPDDDGYLSSPQGQQFLYHSAGILYPDSYSYYYNILMNSPGNLVNPRRIFVGFELNF